MTPVLEWAILDWNQGPLPYQEGASSGGYGSFLDLAG
jgi:hypothetical protein